MRESVARSARKRKRKIIRGGGAAVILGLGGLGTGLAINAKRKKQNA
jgi:hypothetical protein